MSAASYAIRGGGKYIARRSDMVAEGMMEVHTAHATSTPVMEIRRRLDKSSRKDQASQPQSKVGKIRAFYTSPLSRCGSFLLRGAEGTHFLNSFGLAF